MILRQLGSNQTELSLNNGSSIFFSYETPVAGYHSEDGFFKTDTYYSKTTSRHINQYFKHVDDNGFFKTETYYSKTTSRHINQYFKHVDAGDISIVPDNYIVDRVNHDVK